METTQSHWAPQLRPNGDGAPSSVSQKLPLPTISFLGLPRELRDKIYIYLIPSHLSFTMQNQSREETYWWKGRLQTRHHPINHYLAAAPVLLLNHQIRGEMLSAIYAKTVFTFNWRRRASFILTCLQFIPEQAKKRIAHLSWTEWSLHTGGERRGYTGWAKVMRYVATHFSSLRTVSCSFPSGAHGCHHYHNWDVPRLVVSMLMKGKIEEVRWGWCSDGFSYRRGMRDEDVVEVAMKLLGIPYDEDKDGEMGFEYARLLREEGEFDGDDKVERWAAECLRRSKHEFVVVTDFEERLLRIRRR